MKKRCPSCNAEVKGRSDKIFCSTQCKSSSQYTRRITKETFYFQVDKQLKINRKVLKKFNQKGYTTLCKEVLLQNGFHPRFFTHYWKNKKGPVYLFCYDYGFLEIKKENTKKYLLVEWQEYMTR